MAAGGCLAAAAVAFVLFWLLRDLFLEYLNYKGL